MTTSAKPRIIRFAFGLGCAAVLAGAGLLAWRNLAGPIQPVASSRPPVQAGRKSADCRSCHTDLYQTWADSDHAQAHRPVDAVLDAPAFGAPHTFELNGVRYGLDWTVGKPAFTETHAGRAPFAYTAEFVLGRRPLRQYIVPVGGGRYQAAELAFDPAKKEWFDVFGSEQRQPGEWGHWRGRGMNWNSMCAQCHLTDYAKNYQVGTDTYASTWLEHGVGCVQCHGDLTPDHAAPYYKSSDLRRRLVADRSRSQQTCAPCHARNEMLTGEPRPGLNYDDHFRVTLPVDAGTFYPDGQMRDEDFNWTSLLTSRMGGKAGVTCLDCHDPHSGKTIAPVSNNALCLQCHTVGNTRSAPVIDPVAHSHHGMDSTGNQCVSCHMPTTTYMQRDARHDHGFLRPDPLLTKELGIPNACARCHADKGVDWQIEWSDRWYGPTMDSRQRTRARAVDAAQKGAPGAPAALLALIAGEEVPAWKASLMLLARPWAAEAGIRAAAETALGDPSPMVRSAAVQLLGTQSAERELLRPLLKDPARLVRLDAAWALSPELGDDSPERRELSAYLALSADQPAGQLRLGQDLFNRGRPAEAEAPMRKALAWDPNFAGAHEALGLTLDSLGRPTEAAESLRRAAQVDPHSGPLALEAGLAFAGIRKMAEAEAALREAVHREPALDRAWYNLGLLLVQSGRVTEGLTALRRAEEIAPAVADYPYAAATVLWQNGEHAAALAAARRALAIRPEHAGARDLVSRP